MAQQLLRFVAALVLSFAVALASSAATRNNDDSCDIAVLPAATLLLPYFEVDLGRHSIDVDAAALGNGCSWETPTSEVTTGSHIIMPSWNRNP
jgi:hypothetical protein